MKTLVFLLWSTALALSSGAQVNIPASHTHTTSDIARYITSRVKGEREIAYAAYAWVTSNIRYDRDSATRINFNPDPSVKITAALRRRRGVCENFAAILNDIYIQSGLKSFIVGGYTRQGNRIDRSGHAWCAVRVDNEWFLCDPTWDAGSRIFRFFLSDPQEFIGTHMPFDPMWQLLKHPISHRDFYTGYTYTNNSFFNYPDTLKAFIAKSELEQLQSSSLRIQQAGVYNPLVKNNLAVTKMNIEMIHEDTDSDLYNSAISDINKATAALNNFIQYRNNRFLPVKKDEELRGLLSGIDNVLLSANKKLAAIDNSPAVLALTTDVVKQKANSLFTRLREQNDFLEHYLKTGIAAREALFYK